MGRWDRRRETNGFGALTLHSSTLPRNSRARSQVPIRGEDFEQVRGDLNAVILEIVQPGAIRADGVREDPGNVAERDRHFRLRYGGVTVRFPRIQPQTMSHVSSLHDGATGKGFLPGTDGFLASVFRAR